MRFSVAHYTVCHCSKFQKEEINITWPGPWLDWLDVGFCFFGMNLAYWVWATWIYMTHHHIPDELVPKGELKKWCKYYIVTLNFKLRDRNFSILGDRLASININTPTVQPTVSTQFALLWLTWALCHSGHIIEPTHHLVSHHWVDENLNQFYCEACKPHAWASNSIAQTEFRWWSKLIQPVLSTWIILIGFNNCK